MREKILIVGSADMDLTLQMQALPHAGEDAIEESRFAYSAGGGGAVAALAMTRLGMDVSYAARVGNDHHGSRLLQLYREAGMDVSYVAVDPRAATGLRVAICEDNGNCRTVYYPGANTRILLSDIETAILNTAPTLIYLPTDLPSELLAGITRLAASAGIPTAVEAGGCHEDMPLSALTPAEILAIDDKDTFRLVGTYPAGSDSCLKAAVELEKRVRARYYVIKLAERGLFVYDGRYCHMLPAYNLRVGGTRCFSDSLSAVLAAEYLRNGGDIQAAARFSLAYSALLQKNGADPHYFPQDDEIRLLAAQH